VNGYRSQLLRCRRSDARRLTDSGLRGRDFYFLRTVNAS